MARKTINTFSLRCTKNRCGGSRYVTGTSNIRESAQKIANLGLCEIVITHRHGLLVYAECQFYEESFFPKKLIGRSGRGDTCIASYVAKRLNASPQEATIWAAAVTSLKMEAEGPFQQTIKEVDNLILSKYKN
jgi:sugar/nucleoside kinase (ribokinase family)